MKKSFAAGVCDVIFGLKPSDWSVGRLIAWLIAWSIDLIDPLLIFIRVFLLLSWRIDFFASFLVKSITVFFISLFYFQIFIHARAWSVVVIQCFHRSIDCLIDWSIDGLPSSCWVSWFLWVLPLNKNRNPSRFSLLCKSKALVHPWTQQLNTTGPRWHRRGINARALSSFVDVPERREKSYTEHRRASIDRDCTRTTHTHTPQTQ